MLLTVSLVVLLSVVASSAPAAKSKENADLNAVIDSVLVNLAKLESKQLHQDGISGLHQLRRIQCSFEGTNDASNYRCDVVAERALLHTEEGETYEVDVHFPVTIVINEHGVIETLEVGEAIIDVVDDRAFEHKEEDGKFGLFKKIKKAAKKAVDAAKKIVVDAAKEALKKKAQEIAGKVITGVITG